MFFFRLLSHGKGKKIFLSLSFPFVVSQLDIFSHYINHMDKFSRDVCFLQVFLGTVFVCLTLSEQDISTITAPVWKNCDAV